MKVSELKELAASESEAAREILSKAEQESRNMDEQEALRFDEHMKKSEEYDRLAERQERLEKMETKLQEPTKRESQLETAKGERIEIPGVKLYRSGELRAFKGPQADLNAYKSGRFLLATIMGDTESRQWCREHGIEIRVQTEGVNTAGGYVVPDEMERAVIDLREKYGMFRANARVHRMSSDHTIIPRRAGGITAYFVGETSSITESEKSWNQVELTAKKLGALTRMSTDLSEDAIINIADDLSDEMAWAFAKKEDECGLDGDGTSTYGGMTGIRTKFVDGNHTKGYDASTTPGTEWAYITLDDEIVTIMGLLPTYALARAKWYIHPAGKAGLFDRIQLAAGGNTASDIATGGVKPMFAGYPVVVSSAMPSSITNGTVYVLFGDLTLSTTFGDRRGITIKISDQRYIEYDQIGIQATERFCIVNHDIGDNTTAGPIVAGVGTT